MSWPRRVVVLALIVIVGAATVLVMRRPPRAAESATNKTQPAWSPDGRRVAFTIWSYDVQFRSLQ
jgi:hypothetical protein